MKRTANVSLAGKVKSQWAIYNTAWALRGTSNSYKSPSIISIARCRRLWWTGTMYASRILVGKPLGEVHL